ncbi:hypothetical protein AMELA_G00001310 [Ameiurus melas]|uniref:Uncharacterized protein n=1 Tax=Ameiurus melas TaxID=219545 RepID=A0A7J6BE20_AMEME|nr:hypothetical protein AMELA_G00001310 [Ameiurus melas]
MGGAVRLGGAGRARAAAAAALGKEEEAEDGGATPLKISEKDATSADPFVSPCSDPVERVSTVRTSMRLLASSFMTRLRHTPLSPMEY